MIKLKKIEREGLLAGLTFLSLIMLIAIQVSWILKAARLEEQNFNHRVSHVMINISDEISKRASSCNIMNDYICGRECPMSSKHDKIREIDSIIRVNLKKNNIELDYNFSIGDSLSDSRKHGLFSSKCYRQHVQGFTEKDGIKLYMRFPGRNDFLLAQMKGWFIVSLLFILFVAASFVVTLRMFLRERAMARRTADFINNMVHEFQTPIANIMLASNLIRKQKPNSRIEEYSGIILYESQKMERNVEDLLSVSGIGQQTGALLPVDIHEEIHQLSCQFKFRFDERDGQLTVDAQAEKHHLMSEKGHISTMLSNLIDNALKYNNGSPVVVISTQNRGNNLIITVGDNGIGIPQSELNAIFDKYYRVSTGDLHNIKGFGLGLTCVKKIANLYRGSVKVESSVGNGTTFTITLPLNDEQGKN